MAKDQVYIMDENGVAQYRDVVRKVNQLPPPPVGTPHRPNPPAGGGAVSLGKLITVPTSGAGLGAYHSVTISANGDFSEDGELKPIVIPRIYHI